MAVLTFTYTIGPDTRLTFNEKPLEAIRSLLKGAGFRWSPSAGCWWRRGVRGAADFITALDKRLGPRKPDGACWTCGAAEGYFRPYGAATPVYCDRCQELRRQQERARGEITTPYVDAVDAAYEEQCRQQCGL
jgi:hypothetical protein